MKTSLTFSYKGKKSSRAYDTESVMNSKLSELIKDMVDDEGDVILIIKGKRYSNLNRLLSEVSPRLTDHLSIMLIPNRTNIPEDSSQEIHTSSNDVHVSRAVACGGIQRLKLQLGKQEPDISGVVRVRTGKWIFDITVYPDPSLLVGDIAKLVSHHLRTPSHAIIFIYKGKTWDKTTFIEPLRPWLPKAEVMMRFSEKFWKSKDYSEYAAMVRQDLETIQGMSQSGQMKAMDSNKYQLLVAKWKDDIQQIRGSLMILSNHTSNDPLIGELCELCDVIDRSL